MTLTLITNQFVNNNTLPTFVIAPRYYCVRLYVIMKIGHLEIVLCDCARLSRNLPRKNRTNYASTTHNLKSLISVPKMELMVQF